MQMNQIDSITPLDFTSMKDLFDYIHQSTQASDMLISKIEYLIMKISEQQSSFNTPSTSTTHSSSDSLLSPLINSKDLSELRSNIKQFSFAFFNNITIKPKSPAAYRQVRAMIDFFNNLKSRQMLIPDIPHRGISDIFNIIPSFLIDFLNIFEYSDILSNITQLASHLNTIIAKRKIKLSAIIQYMLKLTSYFKDKNKQELATQLIKEISRGELFRIFFNDESYHQNIDLLSSLLAFYPNESERVMIIFLSNNNIKGISRLIIKDNLFQYISKETLLKIILRNKEGAFHYHYSRFKKNETYLITIYEIFKDEPEIIGLLSNILKKDGYIEQAQLIREKKYSEADDIEYDKCRNGNEENRYLKLDIPMANVKIISNEEHFDFIDNFKDFDTIGIDSEWKPKITIFDENKEECSILQLANKTHIAIIDMDQLRNNQSFYAKFNQVFKGKTFIGFSFECDLKVFPIELKEFFTKDAKVIDIVDVYSTRNKTKCPDLNTVCLELFNKECNKKNQISNWSLRPLRDRQIKYAALDACILLSIYDLLQ